MRKISKRLNSDAYQSQTQSKLPNINQSEFSNKLNDLLDKISMQNRYVSRISQTNMKNLTELQNARAQLKKIAQEKKMQLLNAADSKEIIQQMSNRVKDSEVELQKLFKEMVQARKEIKNLKKEITDLQNENLQLQKKVLEQKRVKFNQICQVRQQMQASSLISTIAKFLLSSQQPKTILYRYCFNVHKNEQLDKIIQRQVKGKYKLEFGKQSKQKLKVRIQTQSTEVRSKSNYIYQRYNTDHYHKISSKKSEKI